MMDGQHTPGPWKVAGSCHVLKCPNGEWRHVAEVTLADTYQKNPLIAEVSNRGVYHDNERAAHFPSDEQLANARLIAAAPAMYEALVGLFAECSMTHKTWGGDNNRQAAYEAMKAANDAIALAEGREVTT